MGHVLGLHARSHASASKQRAGDHGRSNMKSQLNTTSPSRFEL
jgi:hypothetical protein